MKNRNPRPTGPGLRRKLPHAALGGCVLLGHGLLALALWQQTLQPGPGRPAIAALAATTAVQVAQAPVLHVRLLHQTQALQAQAPRLTAAQALVAQVQHLASPPRPPTPPAPESSPSPPPPSTPLPALPAQPVPARAQGLAEGSAPAAGATASGWAGAVAPAGRAAAAGQPADDASAPAAPAAREQPAPLRQAQADHRHCPAAPYPALLRERGIEGAVLLRVRVDPQGQPADVQLLAGSGFRLFDEAALRQVRGCRFIPAARGDESVDSWVEFPVRFALHNG
jgi:protein TonB